MKKVLSILIAAAMVISLFPAAVFGVYSDIDGHWASQEIAKWSDLGIIQGWDGAFRPDEPITRGEMAVIIDRIMQYRTKAQTSFSDLPQTFYTDSVLKANAAGILLGDAGKVRPAANITREEAVTMLGRALGVIESNAALDFADASRISSWAGGYVRAMTAKGYVQGFAGSFNPRSAITRAEVVKILDRAIPVIYTEAKEYTGDVTGVAVISVPGAVLKDMTVTGDLIVSEGVGSGDVTLKNVKVTGRVIVRGGGVNSIHIQGGSVAGIIIEKTDDGGVRVVTSDGAVVNAVYVDDGKDDVILTGSFTSVTVNSDVTVKAVGATISSVEVSGSGASVSVDANSRIETLTVNEQATVSNSGIIAQAVVNADSVVLDGNKPSTVKVGEDVAVPPVDGSGKPVTSPPPASGGGSVPSTDHIANVATAEDLVAALANSSKTVINITDNIPAAGDITVPAGKTLTVASGKEVGSTSNYVQYILNAGANVSGGTFYGSFLVKGDGVTIDGVTVYNKGDAAGESTWNRAAVYAYCKTITIKNSTFEMNGALGGICNGVVILPSDTGTTYNITGNTFNGYDEEDGGYSSAGLLISGGVTKDFLGMTGASVLASLSEEADLAMIEGNTFNSCTNDYQREDWTGGDLSVHSKSISQGTNLLLDYAAPGAKYYITGDITITDDRTIKAGTTLTIGGDVTGTGAIAGTDETSKLVIAEDGSYASLAADTYVWRSGAWVPEQPYTFSFGDLSGITAGTSATIDVTFAAKLGLPPSYGYDGVRFKVSKTGGTGDATFTATDSQGNPYTATNDGFWGPSSGFSVDHDYTATTPWTVTFSEAGIYTFEISLINAPDGAVVDNITATVTVTVTTD